jgi:hypothetical protein
MVDRCRLTGRDHSFSSPRLRSGSTPPRATHGPPVLHPDAGRPPSPYGAGTVPGPGPVTRHLAGEATDPALHRSPLPVVTPPRPRPEAR